MGIEVTGQDMIVELAKLRENLETRIASDENRRIEFAKAFNWLKKRNTYDYQDEYRTPTWTEIFVEIGKLLSVRDFRNLEVCVSLLRSDLENLKSKIKKDGHSN